MQISEINILSFNSIADDKKFLIEKNAIEFYKIFPVPATY